MNTWFKINATAGFIALIFFFLVQITESEPDWFKLTVGLTFIFNLFSWPIYWIARIWICQSTAKNKLRDSRK